MICVDPKPGKEVRNIFKKFEEDMSHGFKDVEHGVEHGWDDTKHVAEKGWDGTKHKFDKWRLHEDKMQEKRILKEQEDLNKVEGRLMEHDGSLKDSRGRGIGRPSPWDTGCLTSFDCPGIGEYC